MTDKVGKRDRYIIAQDAGGSMTDCFIVDGEGRFTTGK